MQENAFYKKIIDGGIPASKLNIFLNSLVPLVDIHFFFESN